jgi:hypothetical protein
MGCWCWAAIRLLEPDHRRTTRRAQVAVWSLFLLGIAGSHWRNIVARH